MTKKRIDRNDGKLLEHVVNKMCSGIENAKISHDVKLKAHGGREVQIDVLIEGQYGVFDDIKIVIEAKDWKTPVPIGKVRSFISVIEEVGANFGAMVSSHGFQSGAQDLAKEKGVFLFRAISDELRNSSLFIPVRLLLPKIHRSSICIRHRGIGQHYIPASVLFRIPNCIKDLNPEEAIAFAWNTKMIPQKPGEYIANFGAVIMIDVNNPTKIQYCELSFEIEVIDEYFLKIFPANFLENIIKGTRGHFLEIPLPENMEEMEKVWKKFNSLENLNSAADIENQPKEVQNLLIRPSYRISISGMDS